MLRFPAPFATGVVMLAARAAMGPQREFPQSIEANRFQPEFHGRSRRFSSSTALLKVGETAVAGFLIWAMDMGARAGGVRAYQR